MSLVLSIVIPVHNEAENIRHTFTVIHEKLTKEGVHFEILLVNDNSNDNTPNIIKELETSHPYTRALNSDSPHGFGVAIQKGLQEFSGDAVCIVMGDLSDSPEDIVSYYKALLDGAECVFGSRFIKGSQVIDYPVHKLMLNRMANTFVRILFGINHNDITNAFKCYRREVIDGIQPILAHHFNLTVELPLKAIVRGYRYATVPISWRNRSHGVSKLKIKEMGSRYLFIVLYILLEKILSKGDYLRGRIEKKSTKN